MGALYRFYLWIRFISSSTLELLGNSVRFVRRRVKNAENVDGKVVIITGSNTGIGKETALQLAKRGAKVIMACRDVDKANKAADEIRANVQSADVKVMRLDLSSLASVREFAQQVNQQESQIDILINNAGLMACPQWETKEGFEMQFGTNHLGHFLLTLLLMDKIKSSSYARIINVSSVGHTPGQIHFDDINLKSSYEPYKAYFQSKLANVLFTRELARRLNGTNVKAYAVHPGMINSDLMNRDYSGADNCFARFFKCVFLIPTELGAQTTLYCALDPSLQNESGYYYRNARRVRCMTKNATDDEVAKRLWDLSCELVKLENYLRMD